MVINAYVVRDSSSVTVKWTHKVVEQATPVGPILITRSSRPALRLDLLGRRRSRESQLWKTSLISSTRYTWTWTDGAVNTPDRREPIGR